MDQRRILCGLVLIGLYWVLMTKHKYPHRYQLVLQNMEPRAAWEFFSDFANVKSMNPTIINYKILSEARGSEVAEDWEYSVVYTEYLVYLPFLTNEAKATIKVTSEKVTDGNSKGPFRIQHEHDTCMLGTCLHTSDVLEFHPSDGSTVLTAQVEYECQLLFSYYCKLEYLSQRALIHEQIYATIGSRK